MSGTALDAWRRRFLPAFTFLSVVIGGGYATGRELVQFFMPAGPLAGLLGMAVTAVAWSVVLALSLELARLTQSYDYRAFFRVLLGRAWFLFEIAFLALMLVVLAVLGAASGELAQDVFGGPPWAGTAGFLVLIALLAWLGTGAIEAFFSVWGLLLVAAYALFLGVCLFAFGDAIRAALAAPSAPVTGWFRGGMTYAGYNIAIVPALLFCARHQVRRREALAAGALAGPIAILPAAVFYVALLAQYPEIMNAPIPLQSLLHALDRPWLTVGMQLAIYGTLVQTGIGILHGFNERLLGRRADSAAMSARGARLAVSVALALAALLLATRIGLIDLIAKGYGWLAWAIIAVYAVPLATVGAWKIFLRPERQGEIREHALP